MVTMWTIEARKMHRAGMTLGQIALKVNRSRARVHQILNPKPKASNGTTPHHETEENAYRRRIRRRCRAIAKRTGEDIAAVYARNGVSDINRIEQWEQRRLKNG